MYVDKAICACRQRDEEKQRRRSYVRGFVLPRAARLDIQISSTERAQRVRGVAIGLNCYIGYICNTSSTRVGRGRLCRTVRAHTGATWCGRCGTSWGHTALKVPRRPSACARIEALGTACRARLDPQGLQLHRRRYEADLASFLHEPADPPVVVVLLLSGPSATRKQTMFLLPFFSPFFFYIIILFVTAL